ncbi:propionate-CoA ligase [Vibrio ishigakensis]|uniref:Propionate-CoA ligase n=1 Tax=Vibrio ishigakensis TaxID=1481914 RepID=A0A0B8QLH6_9VIBR|nr:propionate-CoA ligase [Vibrio ishigakensis]
MIRQIADGEQYVVPSTIDDPSSLQEIERVLKVEEIAVSCKLSAIRQGNCCETVPYTIVITESFAYP